MSSISILKALGLNTQPNSLQAPEGSLTVASNVVIKRDGVIEPRRGFALYGDALGSTTDTVKQLMSYKNRIIRHYVDTLDFDNGSGTFSQFSGSFTEQQAGLRIKSIEANGNLYFTTSDGVKKISAKTSSQLSTGSQYIRNSGGIKAVDLQSRLNVVLGNQSGFFTSDSAVAYRVVWATRDANDNLVLGTPSTRSEIYNSLLTLNLQDFSRVLGALDDISSSGGLISDGNYVTTLNLPVGSSPDTLRTNLISLATKLDNDILFANDTGVGAPLTISAASISTGVCTLTFTGGVVSDYLSVGGNIFLTAFAPATGTINGQQLITSVNATQITFNTSATGTVLFTGASINSNEYRSITQPVSPAAPATNDDLLSLQTYLANILIQLKSEPITVITSASQTDFINDIFVTTSSTVFLDITIPDGITTDYFYQVYRSSLAQATGVSVLSDLTPDDEMRLVYEAFPTSAEITAKQITIEDITLDVFRGANLYTNPVSGEGILQANDIPPFAKDINRFKNVIFYAATKTKQKKSVSLLGVQKLIVDYNNGVIPNLTISNGSITNKYIFVTGTQEVTDITAVADVANSLDGKYFLINSANNVTEYYVWFKTSGGIAVDPAITGKTGLRVNVATGAADTAVASALNNVLSRQIQDFSTSLSTNKVRVTNTTSGFSNDASAGTSGFTVTIVTQGRGENSSTNQVLLSSLVSPAAAVDETARSLVRIINQDASGLVYAYYLSGGTDVPGQFLLEDRSLNDNPFYLLSNNSNTGSSFNPDISPTKTITNISVSSSTVITSTAHGLDNGTKIMISSSNSTPSVDGLHTITYISPNTFSIPVTVTVLGTSAVYATSSDTESSQNEEKSNRIYYSKLQQPEAVPIVNYFDVGSENKAILRIFPLTDSLFVFKEDGLYRISGESSPFTVTLFDSSFILLAPDSVSVANNVIYAFTTQGVQGLTESGAKIISRPIDIDILKLASSQYTGFKTATWGIGYDSDNSYLCWTVQELDDEIATICYRYSNLTATWTTFDKTNTCGIVNPVDDKMYLGAGDTNFIEKERKTFSRYDYADREFTLNLLSGSYFGNSLQLSDVSNITVGDVVLQEQTLSPYTFNALLNKLDIDSGINNPTYNSTLNLTAGKNLRTQLVALANKLDTDLSTSIYSDQVASLSGSISNITIANPTIITSASHGLITGRYISISGSNCTPSIDGQHQVTVLSANTFSIPVSTQNTGNAGSWLTVDANFGDIEVGYNAIISKLNIDTTVEFNNYLPITNNTSIEAIVTEVNRVSKKITLNLTLDYMVGPLTIFKGISSSIVYTPVSFGDNINMKHMREATIMFANKAFTNAVLSFASDLLPMYNDIPFNGSGNGAFGLGTGNFGSEFFGGGSHAAPFRTYIPRNNQRCRFLVVKFSHMVAREKYEIYGITLTGENTGSSRAYR